MKFTFAPETRPLDGYTIKRAIHRGGFGEVYYALSDAGKEVALKLLNNNLDVELRGVTQCLNLKHPNLVTIFDIRQDDDQDHWVVMEYVSGRGLYETMQDYPSGMPLEEVLAWLKGMCDGLAFLHDRGIVHRDLKPANVFREQGVVKVGDVGLSKYISESRRSAQTQSVGTVYYMAPEVARGRYGREVDVYALGIMLYEMLTGRVPFEGQTTAEILMKHLTAEPDLSVLPGPLQSVVAAALEKDPDQRIASVELLEQRFRQAVVGADVRAPVASPPAAQSEPGPASDDFANGRPRQATRSTRPADPSRAETVVGGPPPARPNAARGTAGGFTAIAQTWASIPTPVQWVLGGTAALLVLESGLLRQFALGGMIGGVAYLAYQMVQVVTGAASGRSHHRHQPAAGRRSPDRPGDAVTERPFPEHAAAPPRPRRRSAPQKRIYTPATLRRLSRRQRAADVATSVSVSLAAAGLVTLAIFLATNLISDFAQAVYFAVVTMLAAWGIIIPSKTWEGKPGDSLIRRLILGSVGLGVGYIAAVLPAYLLIDRDPLFAGSQSSSRYLFGRITLADGSGFPTVACFMLFFALLFSVRRWWWQVDSFRSARFRVSSALFTLLVGVVISGALLQFSFPDGLGATWALAISAVVQLSAGWTPPELRTLRPAKEAKPAPAMPSECVVPQLASHEQTALRNA